MDLTERAEKPGSKVPIGGAAKIYREDGKRLIALRFRIDPKDASANLAEIRKKLESLFQAPYRAEWSLRAE
jgi:hypothetical protein